MNEISPEKLQLKPSYTRNAKFPADGLSRNFLNILFTLIARAHPCDLRDPLA